MAPVRHETSGSSHQENGDAGTSGYGTRSVNKRRSIDISPNGISPSKKKISMKKPKGAPEPMEVKAPPIKKRRVSRSSPLVSSDSGSTTPAEASRSQTPVPSEIPEVPAISVDSPNGSPVSGRSRSDLSTWIEPDVIDEPKLPDPNQIGFLEQNSPAIAFSGRGRGRGRGRGYRGGGRWAGRTGRTQTQTQGSGHTTPVPSPNPVLVRKLGRGGRRGRARKLGDPRIQALYRRRDELKEQFKWVRAAQKVALVVIADKSLEFAKEDPKYHEKLPEFKEVTTKLAELKSGVLEDHRKLYDMKKAYLERQREMRDYYEKNKCEEYISERAVVSLATIKERAVYLYHQGINGGPVDNIPFPEVGVDRIVETLDMPPKIVHPVASGHFPIQLANPHASITIGDTEYEQHPQNFWQSLSPAEQDELKASAEAEERRKNELAIAVETGRVLPRKGGALHSGLLVHTQAGDDDEDDDGEAENGDEEDTGVATPAEDQPTPAKNGKVKERPKANNKGKTLAIAANDEDMAPEYPVDKYGVSVPAKKAPGAQNKIIVPASVIFEPYEIGVRKHIIKAKEVNGAERISSYRVGNTPNPEFFYLDQVKAAGTNQAKLNESDLDQELVKRHKLHPKFGVALRESCNPYIPTEPKDYEELVERNAKRWQELDPQQSLSKVIIQQNHDGSRTLFRTSRSEWIIKADRRLDEVHDQITMREALEQAGLAEERPVAPPTPPTPVILEKDKEKETIDPSLISAVNYAEAELVAIKTRRPIPTQPQFNSPYTDSPYTDSPYTDSPYTDSPYMDSPYAESSKTAEQRGLQQISPMVPRSQRSGYDPVRDVTYRTPYAQPAPPPSGYTQGGVLAMLADASERQAHEFRMQMAPQRPQFYAPMHPYGTPSQMVQPNLPLGYHPPGYPAPFQQPLQGPPLSSPQRAPSSSRVRELRPAPPQNRPPPPPPYQQQQQPYGGAWYQNHYPY